jgi:hypothetical protein
MPAADQVGEEPISYLHAVPEPKTGYGDEESPNPFPRPSRGLVPKVAPSEMRNVCLSKGKRFIERLRSLGNWNDIPLPFAEKRYGRGEEWIKGVLLFTYMGGLTLVSMSYLQLCLWHWLIPGHRTAETCPVVSFNIASNYREQDRQANT